MSIELENINDSSGNGNKGGATFPTIVTDSGSSLPSASGYQEGDTFLNTSDKKIYKAVVEGYMLDVNVTNTATVDLTTGIATDFGYNKSISKSSSNFLWTGNRTINLHFKQTNLYSDGKYNIFYSYTISGVNGKYATVYLQGNKLHFGLLHFEQSPTYIYKDIEIAEISADVEYYLRITKTGTNGKAELFTDGFNITPIASVDFETEDYVVSGQTTSTLKFNDNTGSFFNQTNDYLVVYLLDCTGDFLVPAGLSWDSGVSLIDKTEYADKTNGTLYLYENSELVKIDGSLTKKVYTISADNTSTLDVSSDFTKVVDVLKNGVELAITDDYTISSGVITFVTALSTTDKITVKGE